MREKESKMSRWSCIDDECDTNYLCMYIFSDNTSFSYEEEVNVDPVVDR
jgi:hypothetical protein